MPRLAILVLVATALAIPSNHAWAQTTNNTQGDSIVFTLQLTDADLAMLRNGQSLTSKIPPEIRNRVSEVKISYKPTNQTASLNNGLPSGNSGSGNFNSATTSGLPGVGQGSGNRTDSIHNPGTTTFPPAGNSIPRFNPSSSGSSGFGSQPNGTGLNSALVPPSSLTPNTGVSQYNTPLGPPVTSAPTTSTGSGFQPPVSTNPSGSIPGSGLPITPPPSTNSSWPAMPNQSQMRPSTAPTGSEFDTTSTLPPNTGWQQSNPNQQASNNGAATNNWQAQNRPVTPSWQPPQMTANANSMAGMNPPSNNSAVPGHNIPTVGNQMPSVQNRQNYATQNGIAPASIPGQSTNQPQVGANDGTHGVPANTPIAQLNRFNNFMYFLLLCSIGLNIYLGWISRGFYTRYRELADELRDSFSTAI